MMNVSKGDSTLIAFWMRQRARPTVNAPVPAVRDCPVWASQGWPWPLGCSSCLGPSLFQNSTANTCVVWRVKRNLDVRGAVRASRESCVFVLCWMLGWAVQDVECRMR